MTPSNIVPKQKEYERIKPSWNIKSNWNKNLPTPSGRASRSHLRWREQPFKPEIHCSAAKFSYKHEWANSSKKHVDKNQFQCVHQVFKCTVQLHNSFWSDKDGVRFHHSEFNARHDIPNWWLQFNINHELTTVAGAVSPITEIQAGSGMRRLKHIKHQWKTPNSFGECPKCHNVCDETNFSNQQYLQKSLVRLWKNADSSRLLASHNSGMLNTNAECCNELHTIWRTHEGHLSDMSFKSLTSKNQIVWVIVKTKFNMKLWVKQLDLSVWQSVLQLQGSGQTSGISNGLNQSKPTQLISQNVTVGDRQLSDTWETCDQHRKKRSQWAKKTICLILNLIWFQQYPEKQQQF